MDPAIPVFVAWTKNQIVAKYLAGRLFGLELRGVFSVLALLLASIGIYGVMAYTFSRRRNEIGIRMAMGGQRRDISNLVMREGMSIVAGGLMAESIGSVALTRFLQSMLFHVQPADPMTFLVISAFPASVALLACFVPVRRATRLDPLVALRHE